MLISLRESLVTLPLLLMSLAPTACGGREAGTDRDSPATTTYVPLPSASSTATPSPAPPPGTPQLVLRTPGPDGRADSVWAEASFGEAQGGKPTLGDGAKVAVNGVQLPWTWVSEATQLHSTHVPFAADAAYHFVIEYGGKSYKTDVAFAIAKITAPANATTTQLTSPFVIEWDKDVPDNSKVTSGLSSSCLLPMSAQPSSGTPRTARFDVALDAKGGAACTVKAHLFVVTQSPLELGAPFKSGQVTTRFEANSDFTLVP